MMNLIPFVVKKVWDTCQIQGFILLSLSLQTLLALLASFRKGSSDTRVMILIWSAYSAADWTASYVVGLITNAVIRNPIHLENPDLLPPEKPDLLAFWAPFLLLHLGGQDSITAFALEDNELWPRYLLAFMFQALTSAYIFFVSFPGNSLWIPTILVFLAATVKCVERIRALYLASLENFRDSMLTEPDPGPNYTKFMGIYESNKDARLPVQLHRISNSPNTVSSKATTGGPIDDVGDAIAAARSTNLSNIEALRHAYCFFETFKGLFVDLIFSFHERNQSRDFFLQRDAKDAFKVMETELNFIYEVLYTKVAAVRCTFGYFLRFISLVSLVVALVFFSVVDKKRFHEYDVTITYALLLGAVALDITGVLVLISSDWSAASRNDFDNGSFVTNLLKKTVKIKQRWFTCRRWSESIPQYNFIDYCLHRRSTMIDKTIGLRCLRNLIDETKHVSRKPFTEALRSFIFDELKKKAKATEDLNTAKDMSSARGDWVLRSNCDKGYDKLLPWIVEADYDKSLLLWHIATELCYNSDERIDNAADYINFRELSKILSDYMLYLLVVRPTFTSAVAGICKVRFRDTLAEAKEFFEGLKQNHKEACRKMLQLNTSVKPIAVKGDRSKSVLFDACILAKELMKFQDKWEIMTKVWVEMLSYAAIRCRAYTHAQQLCKGGELLTLVWLLMAHFGFGEQFQLNEGYSRAILIVGK